VAEPTVSWTISILGDVLSFAEEGGAPIRALENEYTEVLSARLGETIGRICASDRDAGESLAAKVDMATNDDLVGALLLPATSRRLVTRLHDLPDVAAHLGTVLPSMQRPEDRPGFLGTFLGDIPVFADPADQAILEPVRQRIDDVFRNVERCCPPAVVYVRAVMRELYLRIDPVAAGFFSNSPQGFVGRAVLTNPHIALVDDVVLAEAIVHETTHGFVGMSEAIGLAGHTGGARWLVDDGPYDGVSRVVSPWTGTKLDIPTYLHACFVWWGLLHFWSGFAGVTEFDTRRVRTRILRAATGFLDAALVTELSPFRDLLQPALFDTLCRFGHAVDGQLVETGLDRVISATKAGIG
jgi:hypothetical protein